MTSDHYREPTIFFDFWISDKPSSEYAEVDLRATLRVAWSAPATWPAMANGWLWIPTMGRYQQELIDRTQLPGTTDENRKGLKNDAQERE